jgi:hypothetical protein
MRAHACAVAGKIPFPPPLLKGGPIPCALTPTRIPCREKATVMSANGDAAADSKNTPIRRPLALYGPPYAPRHAGVCGRRVGETAGAQLWHKICPSFRHSVGLSWTKDTYVIRTMGHAEFRWSVSGTRLLAMAPGPVRSEDDMKRVMSLGLVLLWLGLAGCANMTPGNNGP